MTAEPRWIGKRALLLLHTESLAEFGGLPGLRDEGLLESALARPQNAFAYSTSTTAELAAAYAFEIARNHPFIDGNKHAAFLALGLLLTLNGSQLTASQADAFEIMLALTAGELSEPELAIWIQRHSSEGQ